MADPVSIIIEYRINQRKLGERASAIVVRPDTLEELRDEFLELWPTLAYEQDGLIVQTWINPVHGDVRVTSNAYASVAHLQQDGQLFYVNVEKTEYKLEPSTDETDDSDNVSTGDAGGDEEGCPSDSSIDSSDEGSDDSSSDNSSDSSSDGGHGHGPSVHRTVELACGGSSFLITFEPAEWRVAAFKANLLQGAFVSSAVASGQPALFYGRREMDDSCSLADYNIPQGAVLYLKASGSKKRKAEDDEDEDEDGAGGKVKKEKSGD